MTIAMRETSIGGSTWQLNTLGAVKGLECLAFLGSCLGGPMGIVSGSLKKNTLTESTLEVDINGDVLGRALSDLTSRINNPETVSYVTTLLTGLLKNKKPVDFDHEFSANYGVLSRLIVWATKENFQSFFDENPLLSVLMQRARGWTREISIGESGV